MDNKHHPSDTDSLPATSLYHIDNKVEFDPQKCLLRSVNADTTFTLLAASSECFLILLMNHGRLVNKSKLFYQGWEKYGLHVSDNTFYQNILVLRKGLKACGIDYEVIRTLPRKGLIIPDTIHVSQITMPSAENSPPLSAAVDLQQAIENDALSGTANTEAVLKAAAPLQAEILSALPEHTRTTEAARTYNCHEGEHLNPPTHFSDSLRDDEKGQDRKKSIIFTVPTLLTRYRVISLLLLVLCATSFLYFIYSINSVSDSYFSHYIKKNMANGCNVYISANTLPALNIDEFLSKKGIGCEHNETIYVSTHEFIARKSVLKCSKPFGSDSKENPCISYYILDGEYDE